MNYLIMAPIHQSKSEEVGDTLIDNIITKDIKMKTVAPYNHQSLQVEHGIKSLSTILMKHLTNLGKMWPKYLPLATFAYNTFNTPNLGNYTHLNWYFVGNQNYF